MLSLPVEICAEVYCTYLSRKAIYPTLPLPAERQGTQNTHRRALPEGKSPLLIIASLPSHIFCFLLP
nr:MAG TPA: hypothetical protein [Caudoviricetes sp.]